MRIRYDDEVDALSIDLSDVEIDDTAEIEPGVMLDFDKDKNVVGIEILRFCKRLETSQQRTQTTSQLTRKPNARLS